MVRQLYDLTDFEWSIIQLLLPCKPRGVPRVDEPRGLNGVFWRLGIDAPRADIPARYGPCTTCHNRFVRWAKLGAWDRIFDVVSVTYGGSAQPMNRSSVRVHRHGTPEKGSTGKGGR